MSRIRPRLSFGNVVAVIALFVALGGSAYGLQRNSVGTKQLKNRAVTKKKVAKRAIRGAHIKRNSLKAAHIAEQSLRVSDTAAGIVNPNGSTQVLTSGLSVSNVSSGRYRITIPTSVVSSSPVPTYTIISRDDHHVEDQSVSLQGSNWVIDVRLSGGNRLFEFVVLGA